MAVPSGISVEHSVVIGDFGIGSDAPIILDYRLDPDSPRVLRLRWGSDIRHNQWIIAAETFDLMCDVLELPP